MAHHHWLAVAAAFLMASIDFSAANERLAVVPVASMVSLLVVISPGYLFENAVAVSLIISSGSLLSVNVVVSVISSTRTWSK